MKVTDLIVVATALGGLAIVLLGIAQFDPRVRNRFSSTEVSIGRRAATTGVMVLVGAALVVLAIGGFAE
jgi:hypothetical protein